VGEKFYLGSLLDFHTFVKAHWQEKNLSVSGGHVIYQVEFFLCKKRGEYFILFLNVSHLFFLYP
jgi:hypothetical protein